MCAPLVPAIVAISLILLHGPIRRFANEVQSQFLLLPFTWRDVAESLLVVSLCVGWAIFQWWTVRHGKPELARLLGTGYFISIPVAIVTPIVSAYVMGRWSHTSVTLIYLPPLILGLLCAAALGGMGVCMHRMARRTMAAT